ncbi:MAG: septum formation initiator family protein [Spirochaetales bacterium]|nr:septum formation initiator family protein [Spirochaetales bacterium]
MKNKLVLTLAGFIIYISFFSQYSLIDQRKLSRSLKELKQEKEYYIDQIHRDSARLHQLTTDNENLEKFAREQYYMKKAEEDVYVVVEE